MKLVDEWDTSLIVKLKTGHRLLMRVNPEKVTPVQNHINSCKQSGELCIFTNLAGIIHAAARGDQIVSSEVVEGKRKNPPATTSEVENPSAATNFHKINAYIFSTEALYNREEEATASSLKALAQELYSMINKNKKIIGYIIYATPVCVCPTKRLIAKGCPSTQDQRCLSKGKLVNGWVVTE